MARPRKFHGQREAFMTRMSKDLADTVKAEAEARGISYSEYIALQVARAQGEDVTLPPRQKPTPKQTSIDEIQDEESRTKISA